MFLVSLSKSSSRLPYILFITVNLSTCITVYHTALTCDVVLILGWYQYILQSLTSLKMYIHPMLLADVLHTLSYALWVWHHNVTFGRKSVTRGCFFFFCWCFLKIFLIAHVGYLHCTSTFSRCCSSCSANSGVELMVRALCERVLITLYLAAMLWLLSHGTSPLLN